MSQIGYIKGWFKHLFNKNISNLSLVHENCKISKHGVVYMQSRISDVTLGDYSYIGRGTIIHNATIGKFCSISDFCVIGLPGHSINTISSSPIFSFIKNGTKNSWVSKNMPEEEIDVKIGNDVWIGYGAMIPTNVKIGDGAVVGAGAVVVKDVPPYAIVGGVPARVIRYRFSQEIVDQLMTLRFWELPEEEIKKNLDLFQKTDLSVEDLKKWKKN